MPLIKSAKKRVRVSETKAAINKLHRSGSKTAVRSTTRAIAAGSQEAPVFFQQAVSRLDRAASKGSIHANKAARLKSRLAARLKAMSGDEAPKAKTKATAKPAAKKSDVKKAAK